ncbi:hypothetical protein C8Q80DRAFT_1173130 [Daedaleopsis nitida]|nr:hypothetical protein C8Q80DRAFT_1173130 [Daedaleopsis nitida]
MVRAILPGRCHECNEVYPTMAGCKTHAMETGHAYKPAYFCTVCGATFVRRRHRQDHIEITGHMSSEDTSTAASTTFLCAMCGTKTLCPGVYDVGTGGVEQQKLICDLCFDLWSHGDVRVPEDYSALPSLFVEPGEDSQGQLYTESSESTRFATTASLPPQSSTVNDPAYQSEEESRVETRPIVTTTVSVCERCDYSFSTEEELQDHYNQSIVHPQCKLCHLGFESMIQYFEHRSSCSLKRSDKMVKGRSVPAYHSPVVVETTTVPISNPLTSRTSNKEVEEPGHSPMSDSPVVMGCRLTSESAQTISFDFFESDMATEVEADDFECATPSAAAPIIIPETPMQDPYNSTTHSDRALFDPHGQSPPPSIQVSPRRHSQSALMYGSTGGTRVDNGRMSYRSSNTPSPCADVRVSLNRRTDSLPQREPISPDGGTLLRASRTSATAVPSDRPQHQDEPDPDDSRSTLVNPIPTPSLAVTSTPKLSSRFHCWVCLQDPAKPVTTMCGHLFCYSCFVNRMATSMGCPACDTTFFVKLDVGFVEIQS